MATSFPTMEPHAPKSSGAVVRSAHAEQVLTGLLAEADIHINGYRPWDIQVHHPGFFRRVLHDPELQFGETYMDGWWDCDALDECAARFFRHQMENRANQNLLTRLRMLPSHFINRQTRRRAFEVGRRHYDIGNDLYRAMLDRRMNYTCAYWHQADSLDAAQEAKLDLVCAKVGVRPGMRILELGCGWGSFAKYAAEKYGAQVVGVTISREQVALGRELCRGLPVELRLQDYREVTGVFDAVISIGIMEHVGYKNYRTYMEVTDRCLKRDGVAFIHTIGRNNSGTTTNIWIDRHIFPNSMLPSIAQLGHAMEGLFIVEDLHNIGPHYDPTLMAWYRNFDQAWPRLKDRYGERFYRMWRFYLLSCAGSFRSRDNQLWQIVLTKAGRTQPNCRFS